MKSAVSEAVGGYSPIKLDDVEKSELESLMCEAYKSLCRASIEKFGFQNIKKLRDEYKRSRDAGTNCLSFDPHAAKMMELMIANESKIISAYVCISTELCLAFNRASASRPGVTYEDYCQEAMFAIYEAMYTYNGESRFSTYVYWCIKNQLINFARREERMSGVSRSVKDIRSAAKRIMYKDGCSLDEALTKLQEKRGVIDKETLERVHASMYRLSDLSEKIAITAPVPRDDSESRSMRLAIGKTNLSRIERRLVEAYLDGDSGFRAKLSATEINPNTGRLWTKAALSIWFLKACEKIREVYNSGCFEEAA